MEIKQLNELLKNLQIPDSRLVKKVKREKGHQGIPEGDDGEQGEYNEHCDIYQILSTPELFMKVTYQTDSYGNGSSPVSVAFVKAKEKKVTVYEYE